MSLSPFVPLLLAACWIVPTLIILLYYLITDGDGEASEQSMATALKGIRADIVELDVSKQTRNWRREDWEGPGASVRAQVTNSSHEIMVITPYAEGVVTVRAGDKEVERRYSLCLN